MNKYRSHNCSELSEKEIDKEVCLSGWLHRKRDHGNLLFIDLRDHYGITQCVIENNNKFFPIVEKVKSESVIMIKGIVTKREKGSENNDLKTGKIEVKISSLEILSSANELPIPVFGEQDYPEEIRFTPSRPFIPSEHQEPFQDLYEKIGNDLVAIRDTLSVSALQTIQDVSTLVYANDLSPESFGHMLATNDEGLLEAASLPAKSDPMFARVEDMRVRHHAFIDTVDEYYGALHDEMLQAYIMWRRHSYDQQEQLVSRKQEPISQDFFSSSSGYLTMTQRYNRFRWSKIYRQEFQELAAGFNQELAPAILELNEQVHGLSGTMAEQYIQWRRILRQLFELEIGRI